MSNFREPSFYSVKHFFKLLLFALYSPTFTFYCQTNHARSNVQDWVKVFVVCNLLERNSFSIEELILFQVGVPGVYQLLKHILFLSLAILHRIFSKDIVYFLCISAESRKSFQGRCPRSFWEQLSQRPRTGSYRWWCNDWRWVFNRHLAIDQYSNLTLSLLRVIKVKFPLQPHQKYYITQ